MSINICCVGAGYVGGPTMAVIAEFCPDILVNVVDINEDRINSWNDKNLNQLPVFEPGLKEIIQKVRNKNLFFSCDVKSCIRNADIVFISVNTPIKKNGLGAGQASDLRWVESCARQIKKYSKGHTIVVEKSTLPVRTAETIKSILQSSNSIKESIIEKKTYSILSNPEFLAEGNAIEDLKNPDRLLIGGEDQKAVNELIKIYLNWIPKSKIICTNLWSSELSKLMANAFLAQRISSINTVSAICESTGANVEEVSLAIGMDTRIGEKFLNSGPGFGGSCFKKDILNIVYLSKFYGLKEVADFWESVIKINSWQKQRIYKIIVEKLYGNLVSKKIAILGFAFKANTNDTRESPAISICNNLLNEGAILSIHDPKVEKENILKNINQSNHENIIIENNIDKAVIDADAVLILTDWEEYKNLDFKLFSNIMRKPAWVFDTRSVININNIKKTDLNFWKIGYGSID
tara:strand:- start:2292 stop:3680 length:1389 start_codon:yes stop_codon:yes gene_type:complete